MSATITFATPRNVNIEECHFYHTIDIPGHGTVQGDWDLRATVGQYLGGVDFREKSVLEIGPASGFLTIELEKSGATVVAIEVQDEPGWDFVPYPADVMAGVLEPRREVMRKLKHSFWFTRAAYNTTSKLVYGNIYDLPDDLGHFDIAIMCAVLLHVKSPLQVIEQCARHADRILITDMYHPELEGRPVCQLIPTADNKIWDSWWQFSSDFIGQFLQVLGFQIQEVTVHTHSHRGIPVPFFSIVAAREI